MPSFCRPLGWIICLSILPLSACEQQITQIAQVPPPIVRVSVPPATIQVVVQASAGPSAAVTAAPAAGSSGTIAVSSPAAPRPSASQLPRLELAPITGPSAPPVIPPEIEKFEYSIPAPESTRDYGNQDIQLARIYWQQRYLRQRQDAFQVLKMYLDSALIAWHNEALAASLNEEVLFTKAPLLFPNFARQDAAAIAKAKEYAIRSYFRGTSSVTGYSLADFQSRSVNVVSKNSRGEMIELGSQDAAALAPANPRPGDSFKYRLFSSASRSDVELTMIYQDNGWKVDFWTPNILVAFLP